jgi:hypothetical protein
MFTPTTSLNKAHDRDRPLGRRWQLRQQWKREYSYRHLYPTCPVSTNTINAGELCAAPAINIDRRVMRQPHMLVNLVREDFAWFAIRAAKRRNLGTIHHV